MDLTCCAASDDSTDLGSWPCDLSTPSINSFGKEQREKKRGLLLSSTTLRTISFSHSPYHPLSPSTALSLSHPLSLSSILSFFPLPPLPLPFSPSPYSLPLIHFTSSSLSLFLFCLTLILFCCQVPDTSSQFPPGGSAPLSMGLNEIASAHLSYVKIPAFSL